MSKTKVYLQDVVTFLNALSAEAYEKNLGYSGAAYSTAATRLFAADMQGEFEEVALR